MSFFSQEKPQESTGPDPLFAGAPITDPSSPETYDRWSLLRCFQILVPYLSQIPFILFAVTVMSRFLDLDQMVLIRLSPPVKMCATPPSWQPPPKWRCTPIFSSAYPQRASKSARLANTKTVICRWERWGALIGASRSTWSPWRRLGSYCKRPTRARHPSKRPCLTCRTRIQGRRGDQWHFLSRRSGRGSIVVRCEEGKRCGWGDEKSFLSRGKTDSYGVICGCTYACIRAVISVELTVACRWACIC